MNSLVAEKAPTTFKTWQVGDVTITRINELPGTVIHPDFLLKTSSEVVGRHEWLKPSYVTADNQLITNIQAFIVEADGLRILVDPCTGNDKPREVPSFNMLKTEFLLDMERAGFPPLSIDVVLCTHLHVDHVGWNTRLENGKWVPTFPNARYLFSRAEYEYAAGYKGLMAEAAFTDSVMPIVDAGLADLVDMDHQISKSVRLEPAIGHTPGHCCINIVSGESHLVITGDLIHHPLQACEPDICSNFCWDEDQARATRKRQLQKWADSDVVVLGTHFADPCAVHVHKHANVWKVSEYKG